MSKKKVLLRGVFINRDTNGEGVLKVGTTLIRVSTVVGILYKKNLWGKGVKLQFEDEKYNCPQEYKEILKMEYGDYMTPPPEKERQGLHYMNCYE